MNGGGGGCGGGCVARYSGGGAGGGCGGGYGEIHYGMSKVQRIMLKYRPIAPKPMAAGSGSSCSTAEHGDGSGRNRRRKRRYVRVNGSNKKKDANAVSKKMKASASSSDNSGGGDAVVTLSLMPETPDRNENSPAKNSPSESRDLTINLKKPSPVLLSFNNYQQSSCDGDHTVVIPPTPPQKLIVTSFVTVECVTETWMTDDGGLGFTDQTRMMNMENDTCPSFITNCRDTVVWTNKAYKQMTTGGGGGSDETTVVVVVKKVNRVTVPVSHPSFTCKVKVTWGAEKGGSPSSVTAPCDVWRLRSGGFAWRLDVKAALCLGIRPV